MAWSSRRPRHNKVVLGTQAARRCTTFKAGYPTYAAALDGAERLMEMGHVKPGCHITPYRCDRCPEWHLYNRVIVHVDK